MNPRDIQARELLPGDLVLFLDAGADPQWRMAFLVLAVGPPERAPHCAPGRPEINVKYVTLVGASEAAVRERIYTTFCSRSVLLRNGQEISP